jgi:hypothetical protein
VSSSASRMPRSPSLTWSPTVHSPVKTEHSSM